MKRILCGIWLLSLLPGSLRAETVESADVRVLAKTGSSWDGNPLPAYAQGTPEVTVLRITIPPGGQLPPHKHVVMNAGVLLRGELTVVTEENKTLHLKAGESIVEVVNTWHYGKNEGTTPAEIIVIYAGVQGQPITVTK
ncbi:MAG: cupin domain-containing protein [Thermoanaerobaculia bacterium]